MAQSNLVSLMRLLIERHRGQKAVPVSHKTLGQAADTIERLQKERDAWEEVAGERGESFARSIEDFNSMRDQRDAALAEVDRLEEALRVAETAGHDFYAGRTVGT